VRAVSGLYRFSQAAVTRFLLLTADGGGVLGKRSRWADSVRLLIIMRAIRADLIRFVSILRRMRTLSCGEMVLLPEAVPAQE
jgi:hypothetical protein